MRCQKISKRNKYRLLWPVMGQSMRFAPVFLIGYWAYYRLPMWCAKYWEVPEMQEKARILADRIAELKNPVIWNLTTTLEYMKASVAETAVQTQLRLLSSTAGIVAGVAQLLMMIGGVWLMWRFLVALKQAYQQQSREQRLSKSVCQDLRPELDKLYQEIQSLQHQIRCLAADRSDVRK